VLHTAATLKDGVLLAHGSEHIERSFGAKLDGAWHLHELTRDCNLSAFVLFSSISGVFGNAGQASYSAANAFLDALAYHRRARGLPGLSLAWGYWGERSGLTRDLSDLIIARVARHGILPMTTEHALSMLDDALLDDDALRVPVRLDMAALADQEATVPVVLRELLKGRSTSEDRARELRQQLASMTDAEAERTLLELVKSTAALVFGISPQQIDAERPMTDLGVDSVMAVELRNRLEVATRTRLAAAAVLNYPTPIILAQQLREALRSPTSR
jgi:acyl carrier protein